MKATRKKSASIPGKAPAAKKAVAKKKAPRWPKNSERGVVDPKTGMTKMSAAVEARRAELVEEGYERLSGMLPPAASQAVRELREAGVVDTRLQALTEGVILLRDTRLGGRSGAKG